MVIETGLSISNQLLQSDQDEEDAILNGLAPDMQLNCKLVGLQVYLSAKNTSVADLFAGEKRFLILYPVEINFE